jgi:hypothetical protein
MQRIFSKFISCPSLHILLISSILCQQTLNESSILLGNLALHIRRSIVPIIRLVHNMQYQLCVFADRLAVLAARLSRPSQRGFAIFNANVVVPLALNAVVVTIRGEALHQRSRYGFGGGVWGFWRGLGGVVDLEELVWQVWVFLEEELELV